MWVILRLSDGHYVTPPGSPRSYTAFLDRARVFLSQREAEFEMCHGNESVLSVESILRPLVVGPSPARVRDRERRLEFERRLEGGDSRG